MSGPRVRITYPQPTGQDSIAEHGGLLAAALTRAGGFEATLTAERPSRTARQLGGDDALILQYNPFAYGRWGFAPELVRELRAVRSRASAPRVVLIVHEPYVPLRRDRTVLMSAWQRLQLAALTRSADLLIAVSDAWRRRVGRLAGGRAVHHLPVGSNLPDRRGDREEIRARLGIDADAVVVAQFGTNHPSRLDRLSGAAVSALARDGQRPVLLNLGRAATPVTRPGSAVVEIRPGMLAPAVVAGHLAAADLFLSPCVDGVTTRRTSVMAALQHGLPVVGTSTRESDAVLTRSLGLRLAPVDDPQGFAGLAASLAEDGQKRKDAAAAARALFDREFAWPVIGRRLAAILDTG